MGYLTLPIHIFSIETYVVDLRYLATLCNCLMMRSVFAAIFDQQVSDLGCTEQRHSLIHAYLDSTFTKFIYPSIQCLICNYATYLVCTYDAWCRYTIVVCLLIQSMPPSDSTKYIICYVQYYSHTRHQSSHQFANASSA